MKLVVFLDMLDARNAPYRLDRVRDAVMVLVATPGKRWEVEFMDGGGVAVEAFLSDGTIFDENVLPDLIRDLE
jgi:hypothetical protein